MSFGNIIIPEHDQQFVRIPYSPVQGLNRPARATFCPLWCLAPTVAQ